MINTVHLGDCFDIMKQIHDNSIDCIITDPPYGMNYQSSWRTDKFDKIENDDSISWFHSFISDCYRILKQNTHIYIYCNDFYISDFRKLMKQVGFNIKRTLVWVKNNHTSGDLKGDYANKTEFILYAQKGRRLLNGGRDTNVLYFDRVNCNIHPTQKPIDINEYLIKKSTNENDIVLDTFSGSGTTAIACINTNRNYICIEKNNKYHNSSIERIKNHIQTKPLINNNLFNF